MRYHLTLKSSNRKTGPIPVSTTSADSCPDSCPLRSGGCYAQGGPLAIHWKRVQTSGSTWNQFLDLVSKLTPGSLWRHNQAGDLPGDRTRIDSLALEQLTEANQGKRGFTYTHYNPLDPDNARAIAKANACGFTVNLSADSLAEADTFKFTNVGPVTTILPADQTSNLKTPAGNLVVICPAITHDGVTCDKCRLCAMPSRKVIIGFPVHGSAHKKAERIALDNQTS